jgi:repressor LexA
MKGLTKKQQEVLDFIKDFIDANKYPPTIREVADKFKISVKGGYDHIKALEKKKYLRCRGNRSRAIEVMFAEDGDTDKVSRLPILGAVAAGKPLFAAENFDGTIRLPVQFLGKGKFFVLNVKGDSMRDAGIMDGDIAVINYRNHAENGDIVVAVLDEAVTLKRFFRQKNRIMLKAENPAYAPIFSQDVKIIGRLECIIRRYDR